MCVANEFGLEGWVEDVVKLEELVVAAVPPGCDDEHRHDDREQRDAKDRSAHKDLAHDLCPPVPCDVHCVCIA